MWVQSLSLEDPLEEGMAAHSSVLAWTMPMDRGAWRAAPMGSQRVRHDRVTFTFPFEVIMGFPGGSYSEECLPMKEAWV